MLLWAPTADAGLSGRQTAVLSTCPQHCCVLIACTLPIAHAQITPPHSTQHSFNVQSNGVRLVNYIIHSFQRQVRVATGHHFPSGRGRHHPSAFCAMSPLVIWLRRQRRRVRRQAVCKYTKQNSIYSVVWIQDMDASKATCWMEAWTP